MNKIKNVLFPIIYILISSLILTCGFSYLGVIPEIKLPDIEFSGISDLFPGPDENDQLKSNSEIIDELLLDLQNNGIYKNSLSSDMLALWLDIDEDFKATDISDVENLKNYVYSEFDYYRNFAPDTFFIRPDTMGLYDSLNDTSGKFDILSYSMYYVDELKCDAVLIADESVLFNSGNHFTTDILEDYLAEYSFDGVLISCETLAESPDMYELVRKVSQFINDAFPHLPIGVEVCSDLQSAFAPEHIIRIFNEKLCDFGYVDCGVTTTDAAYPYASVAYWWSTFAAHYDVPFYAEHRTDKIFSNDGEWGKSTEINEQLKALYNCPGFSGSCFYSVSSIRNKKLLARDLSIFINDVAETNQDAMSVDSLSIDSVNNTVTFTGTAEKGQSVYCSKDTVKNNDGSFNVTYSLDKPVNVFEFRSSAAVYEYIIENNFELITSYFPTESVSVKSNSSFTPYAVSPENSRLFAVISGAVFEMSVYAPPEGVLVEDGYSFFACEIPLNKISQENNMLTIMCYHNGNYFTVDCGYVTSYRITDEFSDNSADENTGKLISPYADSGLGQSVLCKIKYDNTEQIGKAKDYDTYKAYNSALLKDTIDYLERIDVTPEGYLVYELKSGINVYGVDSILINNGYNLPLNNVELVAFDDTMADSTEFRFSYDWLSPITVSPAPQDYKVGYRNFSFNIDRFDAGYVDINFYHSNPLTFAAELDLSANPLFSSCEIFISENNATILRLHLRQAGRFYGFDLVQNTDGTVSVIFKKRTDNQLAGKTVMVDPGHGGVSMVGTALADNSVSESQVTLNIAMYTKRYLEEMGATVIMTRTADTSLPLSSRTYLCETLNPDIFISIHCDGSLTESENGTHTFYFTPFSQPLAYWIHKNLVDTYTKKIYTQSDDNFSSIDRKIKYYPFYVTRVDNCPSVLIETGFMTNYVEGNVLVNPVNQDKIAYGIAQGVNDYFINT